MDDESQVIKLRVPAEAAYARLARIAGAGIASRLDFDEDQIAALRLAIDEVWSILLGTIDHEGTIELTFCSDADGLVVELEVERLDSDVDTPPAPSLRLLAGAPDAAVLSSAGRRFRCRVARLPAARH